MVGTDFWLQLILVLACLFYGARKGGMALGLLGGVGLIVLVFGFGLKPGKPPVDGSSRFWPWFAVLLLCKPLVVWIACSKSLKRFCVEIPATSASSLRTSAGS